MQPSPFQVLELAELSCLGSADPIECFNAFRSSFRTSVSAFFRVAEPTSIGFEPRYSVMGFEANEIIQSRDGATTVSSENRTHTTSETPYDVLKQKLKDLIVSPGEDLPIFQGGALGYLSYDSVRFLETRLNRMNSFSEKKTTYDAEIVFFHVYIVFDNLLKKIFFIGTEKGHSLYLERVRDVLVTLERRDFKQESQELFQNKAELEPEQMNSMLGKKRYMEGVVKLKHHIREGDIFQAVLSDRFSIAFDQNPFNVFQILARLSPAPYQFYFELEGRAFTGASPEMLLKTTGEMIETHPIAGTRPRGKTPEEEKLFERQLLRSPKEKAEHLMLVDLSRNDLGRVAKPGSVQVDSFMKIRKFGGVMHLVSRVTAKIASSIHPVEALASCFPAGTLSGAPKIRAMELISEIEGKPRGFYGGVFLAASVNGELDSCITIRGISFEDGRATIQAGAGIVANSNPEKEYQEICHKSRMTRKALAIAKAGGI